MYKRSNINYIETNYLAVKYIYCLLIIVVMLSNRRVFLKRPLNDIFSTYLPSGSSPARSSLLLHTFVRRAAIKTTTISKTASQAPLAKK